MLFVAVSFAVSGGIWAEVNNVYLSIISCQPHLSDNTIPIQIILLPHLRVETIDCVI